MRCEIFWRWAVARAKLGQQVDQRTAHGVSLDELSEEFEAVDARMWEERKAAGLTGPMVLSNEEVGIFMKEFGKNASVSAWMITGRSISRTQQLMRLLQVCSFFSD